MITLLFLSLFPSLSLSRARALSHLLARSRARVHARFPPSSLCLPLSPALARLRTRFLSVSFSLSPSGGSKVEGEGESEHLMVTNGVPESMAVERLKRRVRAWVALDDDVSFPLPSTPITPRTYDALSLALYSNVHTLLSRTPSGLCRPRSYDATPCSCRT